MLIQDRVKYAFQTVCKCARGISMSEVASLCLDAIKREVCCKRILGHLEPSALARCAAAGQVCASQTGSLLLAFSADPGSSCQSRHKSSLPPLPNKQIQTALLETDAKTLAHASVPKQNQADLHLNTTIMHTHTCPSAIHPQCHFTAVAAAGIPRQQP